MKKKILIGSILTVSILMILPSVSAVEFSTAFESNKAQILEQIKNIDMDELKEKLKNIDSNERIQLLQSFIKSLHNKSNVPNFLFILLYVILMIWQTIWRIIWID